MAGLNRVYSHQGLINYLISTITAQTGLQICTSFHYLSLAILAELMKIAVGLWSADPTFQAFLLRIYRPLRDWFISNPLSSIQSIDRRSLRLMADIVKYNCAISMLKKGCSEDQLYRFGETPSNLEEILPSPSIGLFTTNASEVSQRTAYVSRIAFILYALPASAISRDLDLYIARLSDNAKTATTDTHELRIKVSDVRKLDRILNRYLCV